jgi:hypothetical protein
MFTRRQGASPSSFTFAPSLGVATRGVLVSGIGAEGWQATAIRSPVMSAARFIFPLDAGRNRLVRCPLLTLSRLIPVIEKVRRGQLGSASRSQPGEGDLVFRPVR